MRKILTYLGILVLPAVLSWSCHLEDFNMDKLTTPKDIKPMVYAPLAYGNYKVSDVLTTPYADNDTITDPVTLLDPIIYDKSGVSLTNNAIDSLYLIVNFTNGTPMKMQVLIKFTDLNSGAVYGKTYDSGIMPAGKMDAAGRVIEPVTTRVEFPMNGNDLNNISAANGLEYTVRLFQPDSGVVIVKNLKESLFGVQLSFRAPLSLWKL